MSKNKMIIIDLSVKQTSPAGSCVLSEIVGLSETFEIHLFSNEVEEELKNIIVFHPVKAVSFPLFARYISFFINAKRAVNNFIEKTSDVYLIQTTQGQYTKCTVSYPHFCHKAYLRKYWKNSTVKGVKKLARRINHLVNMRMESRAFQNAKCIVVPSRGLYNELSEFYPQHTEKIEIISNPIDISRFEKPKDFDKRDHRKKKGIEPEELVIAFIALGDFARKGLPELIHSLTEPAIKDKKFKILVVGGKSEEVRKYQELALKLQVKDKIQFVGFQKDIRSYLWISDLFALPSIYEIFPLVCVQAAAAGLPMLVSKMHGVEEYLKDKENGWLVERNAVAIASTLKDISSKKYDLYTMGKVATESVRQYDHKAFRTKWNTLYDAIAQHSNNPKTIDMN